MCNNHIHNVPSEKFISFNQAAAILNLTSSDLISHLEKNELASWKMQRGDYRISFNSIVDFLAKNGADISKKIKIKDEYQLIIIEDDDGTREMYSAYCSRWALPLDVVIYSYAHHALQDLQYLNPMAILTDLKMSQMDGFELIDSIRKVTKFPNLPIIAITGMNSEYITLKGGLDADVLILNKPIDMDWLKGFLKGLISMHKSITA